MALKSMRAAASIALTGVLVLAGCTSDPDEPQDQPTSAEQQGTDQGGDPCRRDAGITQTADGEFRFTAGPGDWNGYNNITSKTYSTYNSVVAQQMFSGFVYFGTDGTICENKEFGTVEKVSDDPLTVKYTIDEKAVWSDGTPITTNDFILHWTSQNPEWLVPGYANGKDEKAEPLFDNVGNSWAKDSLKGPEGEVGSKEFTVTYDNKNPDYMLMVEAPLPAHVVAKKIGMEPDAFAEALKKQDKEAATKAAKFWNEGWMFEGGKLPDMSEVPSSGPYKLKEGGWTAKQSLTLTANDKYWGAPAGTRDMVFRFIEDGAQVQALQNGDVHAISPQATVDTKGQLDGLGSSVTVESYATLTWEHLDFNFRETSVFSDQQGGLKLRQAFAYCVPRQDIVDKLVKPINDQAVVMNAREVFPFQDDYQDIVGETYDGSYDNVDIEKAKALVQESGVQTPIKVRIGYKAGNERRSNTVAAITASCKDAGFEVEDINSDDFFEKTMPNGTYDLALYAWAGSGQKASGQNIYTTGFPQNYGHYSNKEVDQAWETLASSLDESVHTEQVKKIEKALWNDLHGLPLYAHPGVAAWDSSLQNVRVTSTQDGLSWNAFQWVKAS